VGRLHVRELELALGALHLRQHGAYHRVFGGSRVVGAKHTCGREQPCSQERQPVTRQRHRCLPTLEPEPQGPGSEVRSPTAALLPHEGGGRIGGRTRECARFCTSISEKSIAGAAAETGTLPDSAPQTPLNTSVFSPVISVRLSAASGVPTM